MGKSLVSCFFTHSADRRTSDIDLVGCCWRGWMRREFTCFGQTMRLVSPGKWLVHSVNLCVWLCVCLHVKARVKGSVLHYNIVNSLDLFLLSLLAVRPLQTVVHGYLDARPALTFLPKRVTARWLVRNCTAWWQWCEQLAQSCVGLLVEPATAWSQARCPFHCI